MKKYIIFVTMPAAVVLYFISIRYAYTTQIIRSEHTDHCYERYEISISWDIAKSRCEARGGYLATLTSEEENTDIWEGLLENQGNGVIKHAWLGAVARDVVSIGPISSSPAPPPSTSTLRL